MQRLFSTFPFGYPGAGLVLLRVATAIPLIHAGLLTTRSPTPAFDDILTAGAAMLLLLGLWTPLAGGVIAVIELGLAWTEPDPWASIQLGLLGAALAMLGPGACSLDARLFGRKQIHIPDRYQPK